MQSTKLKPHEKVQAAFRFSNEFEKGTEQSVCKRFGITSIELNRAVRDLRHCKFKKMKTQWNPAWDSTDTLHHVMDTTMAVDIEQGAPKGSDLMVLMDSDFDSVNGILHKQWKDSDIDTLIAGIPYRVLEILRDSTPGDGCYEEALLFADSLLFKAICKRFGLDHEELLIGALEITKTDL